MSHQDSQSAAGFSAQPSILSREEIAARQEAASSAVERQRWQVIAMLADGAPLPEIVAATGYRPRTIREIERRYRRLGAAGLADGRARSRGAPPMLTRSQQHELWEALQTPLPSGRRWTGPEVARWIAAKTGRLVHRQRGWEYLQRFTGASDLTLFDVE